MMRGIGNNPAGLINTLSQTSGTASKSGAAGPAQAASAGAARQPAAAPAMPRGQNALRADRARVMRHVGPQTMLAAPRPRAPGVLGLAMKLEAIVSGLARTVHHASVLAQHLQIGTARQHAPPGQPGPHYNFARPRPPAYAPPEPPPEPSLPQAAAAAPPGAQALVQRQALFGRLGNVTDVRVAGALLNGRSPAVIGLPRAELRASLQRIKDHAEDRMRAHGQAGSNASVGEKPFYSRLQHAADTEILVLEASIR